MRRWLQWRNLESADRTALLFFALALPAIDSSLRLFGYRRTRRLLDSVSRRSICRTPTHQEVKRAERLAQLARVAGRRGAVQVSCLRQALVLNLVLRRKGFASEVQFGVAPPDEGGFNAHAWVELDGVALGEHGQPAHIRFRQA